MSSSSRALRLGLAAVLFTACLGSPEPQPIPPTPTPPKADEPAALPAIALPVPLHRQATDYSCGAASLLAVLWYWQVFDGGESDLYEALGTNPDSGTAPDKIVTVARAYGLTAEWRQGVTVDELRAAVGRGDTVIANIQAWNYEVTTLAGWRSEWGSGHYLVVVGFEDQRIYFMDPIVQAGYAWLPVAEFEARWHDVGWDELTETSTEIRQGALFIRGQNALAGRPAPYRIE